uniref:Large ribosomal subunit protein eL34 n=1 Tax=Macrostomum lignano TaxID=282301 RepID=A0A1I8FC47_9PLAT
VASPTTPKSNRRTVSKTPGGRLVYLYRKKLGAVPKWRLQSKLHGPTDGALPHEQTLKTVNRAYGGSRCHKCVTERIVRAFLGREQKIVQKVMRAKAKASD